MAIHIRDPETDSAIRQLCNMYRTGPTETVKRAVKAELERAYSKLPLRVRAQGIVDEVRSYPLTGQDPDKHFYDWLSGEED